VKEPKCPECDKLHAVKEQSQAVGEFIDWVQIQGMQFCRAHKHTDACYTNGLSKKEFRATYKSETRELAFTGTRVPICTPEELKAGRFNKPHCGIAEGDLYPIAFSIEETLAKFFGINLVKVENEKRRLINWMREREALRSVVKV